MFNKKILSLVVATSMSLGMFAILPINQVEAKKAVTTTVTKQELQAQLQNLRNELKVVKKEDSKQEVIKRQQQIKKLKQELNKLKDNAVNTPDQTPVTPEPEVPESPEDEMVVSKDGVQVTDFGVVANANFYNPKNGNHYVDKAFKTPAHDDTEAINTAIKYANENGIKNVFIPEGKYLINPQGDEDEIAYSFQYATNGGIQLQDNVTLNMTDNTTLVMNTGDKQGYSLINIEKKKNASVIGGKLIGDKNTHPQGDPMHNYCYGITISNASENILVKDVDITNMEDDGIMIVDYLEVLTDGLRTKNVEIRNVKSHNNGRQGLTISTGSNIVVADSEFSSQTKHDPKSGIDIELESFDHVGVRDIQITGNTFNDNEYSGLVFSDMFNDKPDSMSHNVDISSNNFANNRFGVIASGKITGLNISENDIKIDHLVDEFSTGIGSTSDESKNVSIQNNKITSENKENFSSGIINLTDNSLITGNSLRGQRNGIILECRGPRVENNKIADFIEAAILKYELEAL